VSGHPFQLTPPPLVCTTCRRRPVRRHPIVGYYRMCTQCSGYNANRPKQARGFTRCRQCGVAGPFRTPCCSAACARVLKAASRARDRAVVLAALGGKCSCSRTDCGHGDSPCPEARAPVLEVEHTRNDGAAVRYKLKSRRGATNDVNARYRRALSTADHGMQLLCANCHRWITHLRRNGDA
jgi:hypothetical protein